MARHLLTGASGFIGQHLAKMLTELGHQVIALPRELLLDPPSLQAFLAERKPDYVFHLAAYGNKYDQQDERQIVEVNIIGTFNLLESSQHLPLKAFINVGSSSEYGTKSKPMVETDSLDTNTFYGASKASSALLCRAFATKYNRPVVTARPFSIYGEGDDPKHFIPTAIKAFKEGEELKLAKGVHDWTHVEDLAEGLLIVAKNAEELKGMAVNIGTGLQTTNYEVVSLLRQTSGLPGNVKHVDLLRSYDNTTAWVADNSLIKSLGWVPQHKLETDLERMYWSWR